MVAGNAVRPVVFEGMFMAMAFSHEKRLATIAKTVEELGADAVVMARRGRTGLTHLLFGSVAEAVLASSRVPILLVHALAGEAPEAPFYPAAAPPRCH